VAELNISMKRLTKKPPGLCWWFKLIGVCLLLMVTAASFPQLQNYFLVSLLHLMLFFLIKHGFESSRSSRLTVPLSVCLWHATETNSISLRKG
jgi:hypothetical protein